MKTRENKQTTKMGEESSQTAPLSASLAKVRAALAHQREFSPALTGIPRAAKFPCDPLAEPARFLPGRNRGGTVPLRINNNLRGNNHDRRRQFHRRV
jgi:hypothetical protein